jgi:hypothetical protein
VSNTELEPTVELDDDLEGIQAYYELRGWSDGLPIIPPTLERVERFVGIVGRDPSEVVCTLAPRNGEATVERVAANAVMAGCRAEDFPIVLAAVEAVADPALNLNAIQSTTHPTAILLLLSGPAAQKAAVASGPGCFGPGPGLRGNLSIGRALRLALLNIGGGSPGEGDRATQGSPAKIGYCIAENVEESPWAPYHTDHGFKVTDSVLTAIACEGPHNIQDHYSISGLGVLTTIAGAMAQAGSNNILSNSGFPILAFGPEHAHQVAVSGYSKADVQRSSGSTHHHQAREHPGHRGRRPRQAFVLDAYLRRRYPPGSSPARVLSWTPFGNGWGRRWRPSRRREPCSSKAAAWATGCRSCHSTTG